MTIPEIVHLLESYRYSFSEEDALQKGIAAVLELAGVEFVREYRLGAGRIDFYLPSLRCGIEIKAANSGGGPSKVTKQLLAYADHPEIDSLIAVSTRFSLRYLPTTLRNKPLYKVILWANGL